MEKKSQTAQQNNLNYTTQIASFHAKIKQITISIHRRIPSVETYTLSGLYPDTLYYIWLAARSQRGEGENPLFFTVN